MFALFSRKAEIYQTWKVNTFYILLFSAKSCSGYAIILIFLFCIDLSTKMSWGLSFNGTHFLLLQNMPKTLYFFLSSGGHNFKTNYLKDKMRHEMWVHILLNNLVSSPLEHGYYFWHMRSKCYEKVVNFYPEIFEIKVFLHWNN